jgi:hypothetical protein
MITQLSSLARSECLIRCDSMTTVADLLAARPEHELRELLDKTAAQLKRLEVEIEQLQDALARQARRSGRGRAGGGRSNIRERVFEILERAPGPLTPKQILAAMGEDTPRREALYNTLSRMASEREGLLVRADGAYKLAGRDVAPSGDVSNPDQNGGGGPLSMASHVPEAS